MLMKHHVEEAFLMSKDLNQIQHFDPEFVEVLIKYSKPVMVHNQLVRNRHHQLMVKTYHAVNAFIDPINIRLFADFIGFKDHLEFSSKYYEQVRDMFYSQISYDKMNTDFLSGFVYQAKQVIQEAVKLATESDTANSGR
jgi:hypothetical protein